MPYAFRCYDPVLVSGEDDEESIAAFEAMLRALREGYTRWQENDKQHLLRVRFDLPSAEPKTAPGTIELYFKLWDLYIAGFTIGDDLGTYIGVAANADIAKKQAPVGAVVKHHVTETYQDAARSSWLSGSDLARNLIELLALGRQKTWKELDIGKATVAMGIVARHTAEMARFGGLFQHLRANWVAGISQQESFTLRVGQENRKAPTPDALINDWAGLSSLIPAEPEPGPSHQRPRKKNSNSAYPQQQKSKQKTSKTVVGDPALARAVFGDGVTQIHRTPPKPEPVTSPGRVLIAAASGEHTDAAQVNLEDLKRHIESLGDEPCLIASDTQLPDQLRELLATFPNSRLAGLKGSGKPGIANGVLTLSLVVKEPAWPIQLKGKGSAKTVTDVTAVKLAVTQQGAVTLTLTAAFAGQAVTTWASVPGTGILLAETRPQKSDAFTLDQLVKAMPGGDSLKGEVRKELDGYTPGTPVGFMYRLLHRSGSGSGYHLSHAGIVLRISFPLPRGSTRLSFDVTLRLPDLGVRGALATDVTKPTVGDLLTGFGVPVTGLDHLTVSELSFQAVLGERAGVRVVLGGSWSLGDGRAIEQLAVDLSKAATGTVAARIHGVMKLAEGITLAVTAVRAGGSWRVEGGVLASDTVTVTNIVKALGLSTDAMPQPLRDLKLSALRVEHTTGTSSFDFTCLGDLPISGDTRAAAGITVTKTSGAATYGGYLRIGAFALDLTFDRKQSGTTLLASCVYASGSGSITLRDWLASLSPTVAALVPEDLFVELRGAKFATVTTGGQTPARQFVLGLDLGADIGLSKLPLVGELLPADTTFRIDGLQVVYSSGEITADAVGKVNALLPSGLKPLPAAGLGPGLAALATLTMGQDSTDIALGVPPAPAPTAVAETPDAPTAPVETPDAPAAASGGVWLEVGKKLGVLQLNRVGLTYQEGALLFALDAVLSLGPVEFSLDGLAVGSSLHEFAPAFSLAGLGLAYQEPPVTVSGALLRLPQQQLAKNITLQFDGTATVDTPACNLAAIGSYAQFADGTPSLFVFAQLEYPLGGPPPLFLTGLMAGFGIHRQLTLPTVSGVTGFPLLVLNDTSSGPVDPSAVLDILEGRKALPDGTKKQWIAPRKDQYWLALGVEFTSFELVRSKVLLAVEFGEEFVIAVLGTSTLQLPLPAEDAGSPYVFAELGLEAVCRPAQGVFELDAQLSPSSYVLTPACHLTGGFACSVWFGPNPNAGQFVLTLGGYHPDFSPPASYPRVPRLGVNWAVSDTLTVTADAYLAVTPSCVMAGATLSATFHAGALRAWFLAQADFLVSWRPFHYTASIKVSIGASYRVDTLVVHKTLQASVDADLKLWGPPTGGTVTAHLAFVSKTISFGPDPKPSTTDPLKWSEFATQLPKADEAVTINAVSGLDGTLHDVLGTAWLARSRDLRLVTQSAVPASRLRFGADPGTTTHTAKPVNVRPMDRTGLVGDHHLTISYEGEPLKDTGGWVLKPRTRNVPASLWDAPPAPFTHTPAKPDARTLDGVPVGYEITAPRPALAPSHGVFSLSVYAQETVAGGVSPLPDTRAPDTGFTSAPDPQVLRRIATIDSGGPDGPKDARTALHTELAATAPYLPNGSLARLAAGAGRMYADFPLTQKVSPQT